MNTNKDNSGRLNRTQNAIALCVIVILGFNWKLYETQSELQLSLAKIHADLSLIDRLAQHQQQSRLEGVQNQILQTRNALYAVVPCDRNPGGKCPVITEPGRRIKMAQHLIKDLGAMDLKGLNLQGLNLQKIDFSGVDLSYSQLDYSNLSGVNLAGLDLRHASMIGTDLSGANLTGTILVGSNLSGAGLENANLQNAQLQAAVLRNAHACKADFTNANLGATWFGDALLLGVDFTGTMASGDYRGALVDEHTKWGSSTPENIVIHSAQEAGGFVTLINPSYGPDVAPFKGVNHFKEVTVLNINLDRV